MKRILLLLCLSTAAFAAGTKQTPLIEIVAANDTTVTYRELLPERIALDPDAALYHYAGCPNIKPHMQWAAPAMATLRGFRRHACTNATKGPQYETKTETRRPRNPKLISVLYLGNSLVYYNEVPRMTSAIGAREPTPLFVDAVTRSGVTLEQLWFTTVALKKLWLEHWDYVVVQGGGGGVGPTNRADEFNLYLNRFADEVRKSGAQPLYYMPWRMNPNQAYIDASIAAAKRARMRIAPVAVAWADLVNARRFERLDRDGVHQDARGAYLIAVTVYSTIYNKPAYGAPHDFAHLAVRDEVYDDALREQEITDVHAKLMQDAAWRAIEKIR
ncbi:MAG TPA: hypothetical protein VHW00_03725 [Thermoanaerobaculia bacterium]|nr:hypothetical protein [Thermoanaerobaculia bacterium]